MSTNLMPDDRCVNAFPVQVPGEVDSSRLATGPEQAFSCTRHGGITENGSGKPANAVPIDATVLSYGQDTRFE